MDDDHYAIGQLVARCAFAFDERDVDAWLACWAADGTLHRAGGQTVTGHEALADYLRGFPGRGRHVVTNSVIEVAGALASHRAYVQYFDRDEEHALALFGVYDDRIARDGGAWRFVSRRTVQDVADHG